MLSSLRFPLFIRSALLTFGVRLRPQEQREPSSAAANAAARRSTRAIVASLFFGKINHLYSCISSSTSLSFWFSFWGFFTLISLLRRSRKRAAGKNWLHCCQNLKRARNSSLLTIIYQPCNFRTIPAISQKSRKKFLFSYECLSFLHPKNHVTATVLLLHFTTTSTQFDFIHVRFVKNSIRL